MKPKKRQKPWDILGISKSTFYRNKRKGKPDPAYFMDGKAEKPAVESGERKVWVQVPPPAFPSLMAFEQKAISNGERAVAYDARKAYADEMVERALVEDFILSFGSQNMMMPRARGQIISITANCARALSNYAAYALIKKDADRERREDEARAIEQLKLEGAARDAAVAAATLAQKPKGGKVVSK